MLLGLALLQDPGAGVSLLSSNPFTWQRDHRISQLTVYVNLGTGRCLTTTKAAFW